MIFFLLTKSKISFYLDPTSLNSPAYLQTQAKKRVHFLSILVSLMKQAGRSQLEGTLKKSRLSTILLMKRVGSDTLESEIYCCCWLVLSSIFDSFSNCQAGQLSLKIKYQLITRSQNFTLRSYLAGRLTVKTSGLLI